MGQRLTTPRYLRTAQVADLFHVSPRAVNSWAKEGKLPHMRTFGGHYRFPEPEIRQLAASLVERPVDNGRP
jgi:excisionase family DNA binding protein